VTWAQERVHLSHALNVQEFGNFTLKIVSYSRSNRKITSENYMAKKQAGYVLSVAPAWLPQRRDVPCVKYEKDRLERANTVKLWRDKDGKLVPADELFVL